MVFGGTVAYANRDPSFKQHIDTYVPGFGVLADYVADKWTVLHNIVVPKTTRIGIKSEPGKKGWQTESHPVRKEPTGSSPSPPAQAVVQNEAPEKPKEAVEPPGYKPLEVGIGKVEEASVDRDANDAETPTHATPGPETPTHATPGPETPTHATPAPHTTSGPETLAHAGTDAGSKGATPSPVSSEAAGNEATSRESVVIMSGVGKGEHQEPPVSSKPEDSLAAAKKEIADKLQTSLECCRLLSDKLKDTHKQLSDTIADHKRRLSGEARQDTAEGGASVFEAVRTAEATLKAFEADLAAASHTFREQLAEAGRHGLVTAKEFESRVHSAVADLNAQREAVVIALELGRQVESRFEEKKLKSGQGDESVAEHGGPLEVQLPELKRRHQEELDKLLQEAEKRLATALEEQKLSLESSNEERLQARLAEQERLHREDLRLKMGDLQRKYELELRDQLRILIEAHGDHLREALEKQAKEITIQWAGNMESTLKELETRHQLEMAKAVSYLKGIESMVDAVATTGKAVREQLSLRVAFDNLYSRLHQINRSSEPHVLYSIASEVAAVREAASGDEFITEIISSIPPSALSKGIQSATGLKTRFGKVKKVCWRVALVPENGGLGAYALSFVHSALTFDVGHVEDDGIPESATTFDLLRLAEVALGNDDLDAATRYVNQLKEGEEARRVARDWLKDARLYLETIQAAELVAAYLSSSGKPVEQ